MARKTVGLVVLWDCVAFDEVAGINFKDKDGALLDRMHCYIPGWEIPKFRPQHFTNDYGFISDYLAEFIRELRKE